uniref:Uncharacterized protein n=1 Tax=Panagrolaimus sp. JU765 TaxID=591449 RepID=A0AC34RLI3_9BILA
MNIPYPPETILDPADVSTKGLTTDVNLKVQNWNSAVALLETNGIHSFEMGLQKQLTEILTEKQIEKMKDQKNLRELKNKVANVKIIKDFISRSPPPQPRN